MSDFQGRYPGYNVLDKSRSPDWDEQTWHVIEARMKLDPCARFFTREESLTLSAVADRILPQHDRSAMHKVPIVPWIDAKLFDDRRDGYRSEGIPAQRTAWRLALTGIDQSSRAMHGKLFSDLPGDAQDEVLRAIERGNPPGEAWRELPGALFFKTVLCITVMKAYYSHPTAWSEIGYSGPSSPRGHVRNWIGGVDPWEAHETPSFWDTK